MDEETRLELIAEAVRYCQRVKEMGMPPSSYTKALREPVFFLWECREERNKDNAAKYRSKSAVGKRRSNGALVYDHAVPFKLLQERLLQIPEVTAAAVRDVLNTFDFGVLITKTTSEN